MLFVFAWQRYVFHGRYPRAPNELKFTNHSKNISIHLENVFLKIISQNFFFPILQYTSTLGYERCALFPWHIMFKMKQLLSKINSDNKSINYFLHVYSFQIWVYFKQNIEHVCTKWLQVEENKDVKPVHPPLYFRKTCQ